MTQTRKEYLQNWNRTHKEYFKQYRQKNKEKNKLYQQKYNQSDKAKIAKAKYKLDHKEYLLKLGRDRAQRNKKLAIEYLGGKCIKCDGVFHPSVFDFHHRDPNEKDYKMATRLYSTWEKIVLELDKCDLLCANCHRLTHHEYETTSN